MVAVLPLVESIAAARISLPFGISERLSAVASGARLEMNNPYESPSQLATKASWRDILGRAAVVVLHFMLWVVFIVVSGPVLRNYLGDFRVSAGEPEAGLTLLQSFNRFVIMYGFLAVAACFLLDIAIWLGLRRFTRPTRWKWLAVTSALIPLSTIGVWIASRPILFP